MNRAVLLFSLLFLIFLVSGCTFQQASSANSKCGNGVVDAGEECDGEGCGLDKVCTDQCKCETLLPPPLPE